MRTLDLHLPLARRLRGGQCLRIRRPHRLCLRAERGTLWVTVDGELDDIELKAGMSRVFDGPGSLLVTAMCGRAVVSVKPLESTHGWRARLSAWLGRAPAAAVALA